MSRDNLWTTGGIVSIPLLGLSLLAIVLIIERIIFWLRVKNKQRRIVTEVLSLYRSDCGASRSANKGLVRMYVTLRGFPPLSQRDTASISLLSNKGLVRM